MSNKKDFFEEDQYNHKRGREKSQKRIKSQGRFGYLKHIEDNDDDYEDYIDECNHTKLQD